jgi:hypothetical protein
LPPSAIGSAAQPLRDELSRTPFRELNNKMMTAGEYKSAINQHKTAK